MELDTLINNLDHLLKYQAYEWGNTRKGYWRIADSPILKRAIDNNKLRSAGYATLMEAYLEWYPK